MGNMKYLIIDGSAVLHRAYHALPLFTSAQGVPTNAVHGFIKMTLSLIDRLAPDFLTIAFDTPKKTFRKELVASYQSQRPKNPEEFKVQVPLVQEFLRLAGLKYYLKEGYEADDVISTLVVLANQEEPDLFTYILTGDKDILQLVAPKTMVIMPKKGVSELYYMDEAAVKQKLGITPAQVVDYKALVGDSSDNYAGIKGIGPKTANKLLEDYQNLNRIYQHLDQLDLSLRQKLEVNRDNALLSKKLAQLVNNVEIDFKLKDNQLAKLTLTSSLQQYCDQYSLRSIKKQLEATGKRHTNEKSVDKTTENQLSFF